MAGARGRSRRREGKLRWEDAPLLRARLGRIARSLGFAYVDPARIAVVRTYGSRAHAYAQIWGLERIFQHVLRVRPRYVVEVLMPAFGRLSRAEQDRVLIHELLHIPTTFSGSLRAEGKPRITNARVHRLYETYRASLRRTRRRRRRRG
ncbi:MAG TPA: putative metallopeptidase [bacterium]|nr:putative metallopeptidase [bacterium]